MKQYLDQQQTARLIELGFEEPKSIEAYRDGHYVPFVEQQLVYSIGELLSFLPKSIKVNDLFFTLCIHSSTHYWIVEYADISFGTQARLYKEELIDALFAELVILKDEGVI